MSDLNRRQRRHAATRERILEAAITIAHEDGWSGVTMRKLADRIDYTHAAIYAYFASKDDLLHALLQIGVERFRASLETAAEIATSPEQRLVALVRAQWDFAWQHPELYQVMHGLDGVAFATVESRTEGRQAGEPAVRVVAACLEALGQDPRDAERKTMLLWAAVHGIVSLTMAGRFARDEGNALVDEAACDALAAWGAPCPEERRVIER